MRGEQRVVIQRQAIEGGLLLPQHGVGIVFLSGKHSDQRHHLRRAGHLYSLAVLLHPAVRAPDLRGHAKQPPIFIEGDAGQEGGLRVSPEGIEDVPPPLLQALRRTVAMRG